MASFEVSIPDFIEIHPILSFAAWQFRVSFIGAAPPRPIPGDGVEVSPVAKPPCKSLGRRNAPQGVWIGVALTFGWQLGLAKIGHPPLHRFARHIHSRVSCKGTRWGKIIFYRIFISICAQASATPATQHAGEGALPCGEDTENRLRESLRQKAPIGHSS